MPIATDQGILSTKRSVKRKLLRMKKSGVQNNPNAAVADAIVDSVRLRSRQALEGEINAGAHHAEVVIRAIYHIPAEITDPADMRRHADFDAATELADSLGCRTSLLSSDNVVRLAFLNVST